MSYKTFANLLVKILGIYCIVKSLDQLSILLAPYFSASFGPDTLHDFSYMITAVPFLIHVVFGIMLIMFSQQITHLIFRSEDKPVDDQAVISGNIEQVVLSSVGIFIVINSLSKAVQVVSNYVMLNKVSEQMGLKMLISIKASVISFSVQIFLGLLLILFSIKTSNLLRMLRFNQSNINS